jgi:beta-galactosidase/beta-glucuronidase
VLDLSAGPWTFNAEGQAESTPIEVGKFWEEQGWDFDGIAWYQRKFKLDAVPKGKVEIVFGACDESATVFLNGEEIGKHDLGEMGWDQRFSFDITGKLRAAENDLRVCVIDRTGPGGLWKGVAIFRSREAK